MSEENFVTDEQMIRAKNVVQKLFYRKTLDNIDSDEIEKFGCLYDYQIRIEGWETVIIEVERFSMNLDEIRELEEVEEIDSIILLDGRLRIYIRGDSDE